MGFMTQALAGWDIVYAHSLRQLLITYGFGREAELSPKKAVSVLLHVPHSIMSCN